MTYLTEAIQTFKKETIIYEFIRTNSGKKIINKIKDFKPYFFIETAQYINDNRIIKEETGFKSLDNKDLKKCYIKHSMYVKDLKESLHEQNIKTYEADIPLRNRYLIDKVFNIQQTNLKVFSLDIETNYENVTPDMLEGDQEITCIGIQDSFTNNKYVFVWRNDFTNTTETTPECKLFKYSTEEAMLIGFAKFLNDELPDIITGWNCEKFDIYYIILRMQYLNLNFRKLSPINNASINIKNQTATIKGIVIFDMLQFYKFFRRISNQTELVNYKLDTVGLDVLNQEKLKCNETLSWLWKNNIEKLIKYNIRDVELVMNIDKKLKIINFFDTLRIMAKCQFEDLFKTTTMVDTYIMSTYPNIKLPSKIKHDNGKFKGAYVGHPLPGLHKNVLCFDLKALYPSIIKSFNISPDTFDPINGKIRINKTVAFTEKIGIIPTILNSLESERNNYKQKKKDSKKHSSDWDIAHYRQYGIKVIMNSFYGYLGAPSSRLYIKEIAETITSIGREIIFWSNKIINKENSILIYNDTDSQYFKLKSEKLSSIEIIKEGFNLLKIVNKSYEEFVKQYNLKTHCIQMEFEKALKIMLFTCDNKGDGVKKRYAYKKLWEEGKFIHNNNIHITGFDAKRCVSGSTQLILKRNNIINVTNASDLEKCDINKTKIMTEQGFKNIKNVFVNKINKVYTLTLTNGAAINCSENHKFLVLDNYNYKEKILKDIKLTDKIPISLSTINGKLGNYDFGRFLGLFLAEGSFSTHGISFSFNINEHEYIKFISNYSKNILGVEPSISEYPNKTLTNVMIYSVGIKEYVKQFVKGNSCDTKHLSSKYPSFSYDCKIGIISGMMQGDGHLSNQVYTTTSKKLIKDLCNLCAMTNMPYSVYKPIKNDIYKPIYRMKILTKTKHNNYFKHFKLYKNEMWWLNIQKIELNKDANRKNGVKMYDIEVDSDTHLFKIANGIVTHNSDNAELTKRIQTEVLNMILDEKSQEEVFQYLLNEKNNIYNGKTPIEYLAFPVAFKEDLTKYGQVSPPIKGAIYANRYLGANLEKGGKYLWLPIIQAPSGMPQYIEVKYLKKNPLTNEKEEAIQIYPINAITFDEECPKEFKSVIDYKYIEDRIFRMKLENIFTAINWIWQPITKLRQQSLC
jgi:DNA polymerase, archaea type